MPSLLLWLLKGVKTMELLGIEMPFEEFDRLLCEQSKGKELVVKMVKWLQSTTL